jgi:hypothetical protein
LRPKRFDGTSENISSQAAGVEARFVPPGHSSQLKIIGQFSIATLTPRRSAWSTRRGHTFRNSRKLSGTFLVLSRPTKVPTVGTPSLAAASITFRRCVFAARRSEASGWRLFG